jgi:hypothetical protein
MTLMNPDGVGAGQTACFVQISLESLIVNQLRRPFNEFDSSAPRFSRGEGARPRAPVWAGILVHPVFMLL